MLLPLSVQASDGIPLQKDVWLEYSITTTEDLPDQITFNLYDSKIALTPIATQTFPKGKYTVDFEFSKSDGVTSGNAARINIGCPHYEFLFKYEKTEERQIL